MLYADFDLFFFSWFASFFQRVRHRNVKYSDCLSDRAFEDDGDETGAIESKESVDTANAASPTPIDPTHTTIPSSASTKKRRRGDSSSDESVASDDEEFAMSDESDEEFADEEDEEFPASKSKSNRSRSTAKRSKTAVDSTDSGRPTPVGPPSGGFSLEEIRARARAAAAASFSISKKVIPATAAVAKGRAKPNAPPKSAKSTKTTAPQSAKSRIMQQLGLSGRLR